MAANTRQHFLPVVLLKRFATPQSRYGRLRVFDKETRESRWSTPEESAHRRFYYEFTDEPLKDGFSIERHLAICEGKVAPILDAIATTKSMPEPRDEAWDWLITFAAYQFVRTPSWREQYRERAESRLKRILATADRQGLPFADLMTRMGIPKELWASLTWNDVQSRAREQVEQMNNYELMQSMLTTSHIHRMFVKRQWCVYGVPSHVSGLVCSDSPINLVPIAGCAAKQLNLMTPQTAIVFPLGPKRLIIGYLPRQVNATLKIGNEQVAKFNYAIVRNASRFVYAPAETFMCSGEFGQYCGWEDAIQMKRRPQQSEEAHQG